MSELHHLRPARIDVHIYTLCSKVIGLFQCQVDHGPTSQFRGNSHASAVQLTRSELVLASVPPIRFLYTNTGGDKVKGCSWFLCLEAVCGQKKYMLLENYANYLRMHCT